MVIAPTDFYQDQVDDNAINGLTPNSDGTRVLVDMMSLLKFTHSGQAFSISHAGNGKTYSLDTRAEVAVLNRWVQGCV